MKPYFQKRTFANMIGNILSKYMALFLRILHAFVVAYNVFVIFNGANIQSTVVIHIIFIVTIYVNFTFLEENDTSAVFPAQYMYLSFLFCCYNSLPLYAIII